MMKKVLPILLLIVFTSLIAAYDENERILEQS